jgi:hypothetical protein
MVMKVKGVTTEKISQYTVLSKEKIEELNCSPPPDIGGIILLEKYAIL